MSADLHVRAKAVFHEAMELPAAERAAYLDRACGDDTALRREVESWLAASNDAGSGFLASPLAKLCHTCATPTGSATKFCPHCGQVLADDAASLVGTRLDNLYHIEELLGQGGMGAVYRARHALLGDRVAIKTLRREFGDSPTFLRRFQREGQAARAFRHPNAVTVHDMRTSSTGLVYMVLEHVDGKDLRKVLRARERLSPAETVELLEPIAGVLDAAHERGVVHRDMKPENVMIAEEPGGRQVVKVLDLGIAKLRAAIDELASTQLTAVGQVLGTPHYMSPEQWHVLPRDGGTEVDGRTDVYSLGVMAYEMVVGTWPYAGMSLGEQREGHTRHPIPLACDHAPDVPEGFGRAIARAMAKDRADRWPTAGAFVAALRASATETVRATRRAARATQVEPDPVAPSAPPPIAAAPARTPAPATRRPLPWRGIALAVTAVVAVVAVVVASALIEPYLDSAAVPRSIATASAPSAEALRYAVEIESKGRAAARVSGRDPLGLVEGFRFVVTTAGPGRLAVFGPNEHNVPTLYRPATEGPLAPGRPLTFPEPWFGTLGDVPFDTFTLVFIPEGADVPAFAAGRSRQLSLEEQRDLERFREAYGAAPQYTEGAPEAVLAAPDTGLPVSVDVRLRY